MAAAAPPMIGSRIRTSSGLYRGSATEQAKDERIIFDVGGVLERTDFGTMFQLYAQSSPYSADALKARMADAGIERSLDLGDDKEYFGRLREVLGNGRISDDDLRSMMLQAYAGPIEEMITLKKRLHDAGYHVGINATLSRYAHVHINEQSKETLQTWGGPLVLSYQSKVLKPDPKAYDMLGPWRGKTIVIEDTGAYLKHPVEKLNWAGFLLEKYEDRAEPLRAVGQEHGDAELQGEWFPAQDAGHLTMLLQRFYRLKF